MRVLAIDGGGIRGLIPALVLSEIERRTDRRVGELVDLIAGTSTGAIIACALAKPNPMPARRIAELYVEDGPRIFDRSLLKQVTSLGGLVDERYDSSGLVEVLRHRLGPGRLAEARPPLLLTAYDLQLRQAVFLRAGDDASLVDAAHASSAAPSYFEPVRLNGATLVDGGVFATNPSACAYAEVGGDLELLVSLGTGEHTRALPFETVRDWGQLEWARPILDVVFDGTADAVDFQLAALLGDRYARLQTRLGVASDDFDDASEGNLAALRSEADRLIAERDREIDDVCERLTRGRAAP
jgi:patatin-like phospholipase/acyl hydrolase